MPYLDSASGVLAPGIQEVGLEPKGPDRWMAWCVFAPGQVRHFEIMDGPNAQEWLSYVLVNQHGFERSAALRTSLWLFESVERHNSY